MFKKILVLCVMLSLSGCFIKLTPQQHALLPVNDDPEVISSKELKEILPSFAVVKEGKYKLVPLGLVKRQHDAPWCFSGVYGGQSGVNNITSADVLEPLNFQCTSLALISKMDGYAFGTATALSNSKNGSNFDVNILVYTEDELNNMLKKGNLFIKSILFEAREL